MDFKGWLCQFKDKDNAIFSIEYKDKSNKEFQQKYIKGGKTLIKFVEETEFEIIKYIDRIC